MFKPIIRFIGLYVTLLLVSPGIAVLLSVILTPLIDSVLAASIAVGGALAVGAVIYCYVTRKIRI